jgi:hypothetical protein
MKNIFKNILLICILASMVSCEKDFEELNENPYATTITDVGPLFNNVVSSLRLGWNEQFYVHNEVLYKQTQLAALTSEAWQNLSIGTEDIWGNYYTALAHIRDIEHRLDEMENPAHPDSLNNVRGMTLILRAYKTFRVTDLFGDMPYFEAGRGYSGTEYLHPKYDSQEDIYISLLDDLKWASENISLLPQTSTGGSYYSITSYDKLFGGNLLMWKKFANSLRLRHAMRIAEKEPALAAEIIADIFENNLPVIKPGEDVLMMPIEQDWLKESTNWSFREHKHLRMGSNIWNQMADNDSSNGTGFYDPRAFIFFESNNDNKWAAYPQIPDANTIPSGGVPYGQHRDLNYAIKGEDCIYSPFNYFLIEDENTIPEIILTGAEFFFIKSEAYFRGIGLPQDESGGKAACADGVTASMNYWNDLMENSSIWHYTDPNYELINPFDVINKIFTVEDKLEFLYAQRWLDSFRQPWEAYSLTRRTEGTPREGDPLNYFRLVYPPSESEHNTANWSAQAAKMGGDESTTKVWWME